MNGGPGADTVEGGDQRDQIFGGDGDDTLTAADLLPDTLDCGPGTDKARVDAFDRLVGCEQVERLAYNDSWIDLRWHVTGSGVTIARALARDIQGRGSVVVAFPCRGGPGCKDGTIVHLTRTRGRRDVRVRRYGNPRTTKQPFRITAYCTVPGHDRVLSSDRCKRVLRRR